jgi:hypothetical protein
MNFGHKKLQTNPLKGMLYITLLILFGIAMFMLGTSVQPYFLIEKVLTAIYFVVAFFMWFLASILLWDLFKYFKSN